MKEITNLEKILQCNFDDISYLQTAVTHRSYLNEHPDYECDHNERLEFLGDAVLELVVTEFLYGNYENPEGELTNWRAALVNAKMLSRVSRELNIENYLLMSKGESKDVESKARDYILANAMEAVIGAIYLDKGYEESKKFISRVILSKLPEILEQKLYQDAKSLFQEIAQKEEGVTPTYKVLSEEGPDHAKIFQIGVYIGKDMIASGTGTSKQEAQLDAAKNGLEEKDWN